MDQRNHHGQQHGTVKMWDLLPAGTRRICLFAQRTVAAEFLQF